MKSNSRSFPMTLLDLGVEEIGHYTCGSAHESKVSSMTSLPNKQSSLKQRSRLQRRTKGWAAFESFMESYLDESQRRLTDFVEVKTTIFSTPICPCCYSSSYVKYGKASSGRQRYRCQECGRHYTDGSVHGMRPSSIDFSTFDLVMLILENSTRYEAKRITGCSNYVLRRLMCELHLEELAKAAEHVPSESRQTNLVEFSSEPKVVRPVILTSTPAREILSPDTFVYGRPTLVEHRWGCAASASFVTGCGFG